MTNPLEPDASGYGWIQRTLDLRSTTEGCATYALWCDRIDGFFAKGEWGIPEEDAHHARGSRDARALVQMRRVLTDRRAIEDDDAPPITFAEFVDEVREAYEGAEVYIPAPSGATPVVGDPGSIVGAERVIALGLLEGIFPKRQREDSILDDEERAALSRAHPELPELPDSAVDAARERDHFVRLCALATESLILSYPRAQGERDNVKAFYLEAVAQAHAVSTVDHSRRELVPTIRLAEADVTLGARLDAPPDALFEELIEGASAREAACDAVTKATLSELQRLRECPFRFVFRHKFRLRPPGRGDGSWILTELPKRANLLNQPDEDAARVALEGALEAAVEGEGSRLGAWERQSLRARGAAAIEKLLEREFAARTRWGAPDEPAAFDPPPPGAADEEGGGNWIQKRADVLVDPRADALSAYRGVPIVHLYENANVIGKPDDADAQARLEYRATMLWAIMGECKEPLIVEVDAVAGERTRLCFNLPADVKFGSVPGLRVEQMSMKLERREEDGRKRWQVVLKGFKESLDEVRSGRIWTRPGAYCGGCEFADVCRNAEGDRELRDEL